MRFKTASLKLLLIIPLLNVLQLMGQDNRRSKISNDTVVYPNVRIKTDVYVLNTCDPLQVSLRRMYDDDSMFFMPKKKIRKLEVHVNRLSSFKIEGINPLRYKYYINSEAVTQFMDASVQTLQLNNFLKNNFFLSPFDITVPQIFKEDIQRNNLRATLSTLEKNLRDCKDSIARLEMELDKIKAEIKIPSNYKVDSNYMPVDKDIAKLVDKSTEKAAPIFLELRKWDNKLNVILEDYERQMMALPISSSNISILKDYKNRDINSFSQNSKTNAIEKGIRDFAIDYDNLSSDFRVIDSMLAQMNYSFHEETYRNTADLLRRHGYTAILEKYNYGSSQRIRNLNVKEFLIRKRYQVFEEFVLGTATKIGIMLQTSFREISQVTNSLKLQNCLNDSQIRRLEAAKIELGTVFDFVQKTSAEFQILVSYLDIDNKIYLDIAKSINANYYSLLLYLKSLEFIETNNTVEFTLPTSTNLKNIDFIRYKIDREDKISGGKQSYVYDLWVRGGLKVDFSFGIFASGLTDNEYQKHQYDSLGTLTDTVQINRQKSGGYSFGFGGMVNVSPRLGVSWITPGLSFGVIYSSNQKLQLVSALALHLGKTERLVLHAGFAAGFVKTLDLSQHQMTTIEKNDIYRVKANSNEFTIPTFDKFSLRPIFGITYNLSKKSALQAVSSPGLDKYRELDGGTGTTIVTQ